MNMLRTITVGSLSDRHLPHVWSWIYFHGDAEDHCNAHQHKRIEAGELEHWEAPDLVRSDTPIEEVADGKFLRVVFVDGTEMIASIWSGDVEYRHDHKTDTYAFHARRRGLICAYDDEKSTDYAFECYDKRRERL